MSQQKNTTFPYPDPTKTKDKKFSTRLLELARLESMTVRQEALGRWAGHVNASPTPSSTSLTTLHSKDAPRGVAATPRRSASPRKETRSKSARTKSEHESEAKTRGRRRPRTAANVKAARSVRHSAGRRSETCKSTQSMFNLDVLESSGSDFQGLSLESLSEVAVQEEPRHNERGETQKNASLILLT